MYVYTYTYGFIILRVYTDMEREIVDIYGLIVSRGLMALNLCPERYHVLIVYIYIYIYVYVYVYVYLHVVAFVLSQRVRDARIYPGSLLVMEVAGFHSEEGADILRQPCADCGRTTFGWCDGMGQQNVWPSRDWALA